MALWDLAHIESDTADPKAMYQLDSSMTRLNWLESFDVNGSNYFAAAGVCKAAGALNIYSLSL
jgi:hypothetical protein